MTDDQRRYVVAMISHDGGLDSLDGVYVHWRPGHSHATLDGAFSADDMDAIAAYMRETSPATDAVDPSGVSNTGKASTRDD